MTTRLITAGELLQAPTAVDWDTLAEGAGSSDPRQAIEQGFLIDSVSSWVGEYCGQPLGLHATSITESAMVDRAGMFPAKCLVDSDGWLHFWARTLPVISVTSGQWAYIGAGISWQPISPGAALPFQSGANWVLWGDYPQQREMEFFDQSYMNLRHNGGMVQVTYVSGWANALVTGSTLITAGSNVNVPVDSTLGMSVGQTLDLFDDGDSEKVIVGSIPDATHVILVSTAVDHSPASGNAITLSAIPQEIKLAAIWACAGLARARGSQAFSMRTEGVGQMLQSGGQQEMISEAEWLLGPYRIEF